MAKDKERVLVRGRHKPYRREMYLTKSVCFNFMNTVWLKVSIVNVSLKML